MAVRRRGLPPGQESLLRDLRRGSRHAEIGAPRAGSMAVRLRAIEMQICTSIGGLASAISRIRAPYLHSSRATPESVLTQGRSARPSGSVSV